MSLDEVGCSAFIAIRNRPPAQGVQQWFGVMRVWVVDGPFSGVLLCPQFLVGELRMFWFRFGRNRDLRDDVGPCRNDPLHRPTNILSSVWLS